MIGLRHWLSRNMMVIFNIEIFQGTEVAGMKIYLMDMCRISLEYANEIIQQTDACCLSLVDFSSNHIRPK